MAAPYHSGMALATPVDKMAGECIVGTMKISGLENHVLFSLYLTSSDTAMAPETFETIFTPDTLQRLFPKERANEFFDALFGDASEGAYDISLAYRGTERNTLLMDLLLHERPGCCLACNLTQGLPQVFSRHPVINISGLVKEIDSLLGDAVSCKDWTLGYTEQRSRSLHVIPIKIMLER
jgi:hypothetical protein